MRGHDEREGNILQLLELRSADDPDKNIRLREGKYLSPDILNEMIKLMADSIVREIVSEIKSAIFYGVQAH